MKILIVLSSASRIPGTDRATGTWYEELAAPYYVFKDGGAVLSLASPKGGAVPFDPLGKHQTAATAATRRFDQDPQAQAAIQTTVELKSIRGEDFDAVFYPGGLGPVFDLFQNLTSIALIERAFEAGKPIGAVCHGLAALLRARDATAMPLVNGRSVTGFSNSEELAVNGDGIVPISIEDELRRLGGIYTRAADWSAHVAVDGNLVTGQNPASSEGMAIKMLEQILRRDREASGPTSPVGDNCASHMM